MYIMFKDFMFRKLAKFNKFHAYLTGALLAVVSVITLVLVSYASSAGAAQNNYGKIVVIGDSYSRGFMPGKDGHADNYSVSWPNLTLKQLNLNSSVLVGDDLGRRGGAGFCADGRAVYDSDHTIDFIQQLNEITIDKNRSSSFDAVKYIVVLGGYNDAGGTDANGGRCTKQSIKDAISKFTIVARAHFPNAKIAIGMDGWSWQNSNIQNRLNNVVLPAYKEAAEENGLYYVTGIENAIRDSSYNSGDDIHPNVAGQKKIAEHLAVYLKKDATASSSLAGLTVPSGYTKVSVSSENGAFMTNANPNLDFEVADPYMIKVGDSYRVYSTDGACHISKDLKEWEECNGEIRGVPDWVDYVWAPEVYKINNRYYMFASFIKWGSGYPISEDSVGFVGVAVSDDLDEGFTYLGKIDSKIDNLIMTNADDARHGASKTNRNFIDGNLLIDGGRYYLYYKAERNQSIYAIELAYDTSVSSHFRTISTLPNYITRKYETEIDLWGNYVAEAPEVWKHHGYYSMMYSSGNYKGEEYPLNSYAVGYAWSNAPLVNWVNQSTEERFPFLKGANTFEAQSGVYGGWGTSGTDSKTYAPGHNMIYRVYDDNVGNTSEWYNVYHSTHYDTSNIYDYRKLNFQRMGTSGGAVYTNGVNNNYQPLISGTNYNGAIYTQLRNESMRITATNMGNEDYLYDGAIYNATSGLKSWSVPKISNVTEVTMNFNERFDLSDVWISTDGKSLAKNSAIVYINESDSHSYYFTIADFASLAGDNAYKKIQLPDASAVGGSYKDIRIKFSQSVNLTEVTPIRKTVPAVNVPEVAAPKETPRQNTGTGAESNTGTGMRAGSNTGTGAGSNTGTGTGAGSNAGAGTGSSAGAGAEKTLALKTKNENTPKEQPTEPTQQSSTLSTIEKTVATLKEGLQSVVARETGAEVETETGTEAEIDSATGEEKRVVETMGISRNESDQENVDDNRIYDGYTPSPDSARLTAKSTNEATTQPEDMVMVILILVLLVAMGGLAGASFYLRKTKA